jgi:hypothetical protein
VGIEIRYEEPAETGGSFTYSVQRRGDGAFFDFGLGVFRPLRGRPPRAAAAPLVRRGRTASARFDHMEIGKDYIVRVHEAGRGRVVADLPLTAGPADCGPGKAEPAGGLQGQGAQHMADSYRGGKKYSDGLTIEAKHRYTFHGDDGFTVHTATLWADGTSSCNCPRWCKKQEGMARGCPHSERALALTANVDETREQPGPAPPPEPAAPPAPASNPFRPRRRTVDT